MLLKPFPPLWNRFLLTFRAYLNMNEGQRIKMIKDKWKEDTFDTQNGFEYSNVFEWDRGLARKGVRNEDGSYSGERTALGCHYIKSFAVNLDPNKHPRIKDLEKVVAISEKRDWNLVFNILPVNLEEIRALAGPELAQLVKNNRDEIINHFGGDNVLIIDNLELLGDRFFNPVGQPNEDYNREGRNRLANELALKIEQIHKGMLYEDYPMGIEGVQTVFFNSCEILNTWGQMHTLTGEQYFSSPRSSKIYASQPYSITFEKKLEDFQPMELYGIQVDLVAMHTSQEDSESPQLVVDIEDESGTQHWKSFRLTNGKYTDREGWKRYSFTYDINKLEFSPDKIKVYVLNDNESPAYIDDFRIEFK